MKGGRVRFGPQAAIREPPEFVLSRTINLAYVSIINTLQSTDLPTGKMQANHNMHKVH